MASSSSWATGNGRHPVNIGTSLGRAIKNRKNKDSPAPTKKSHLPEREFFSFKFNFKSKAIDTTQPATLETRQGVESTQLRAEYPSTTPGAVLPFVGNEIPAREYDCILIYDTETGTYTLEKLESFAIFKSDGRATTNRRTASPSPGPSSSGGNVKQEDYSVGRNVSRMDEDAEGDDDDLEEVKPIGISYIPPAEEEEESEEEGEEVEIPLQQARAKKALPPPPPPPPKAARPLKTLPKARVSPPPTKSQLSMPPPPVPASALASASSSSSSSATSTALKTKAKAAPAKIKKAKAAAVPAPTPGAPAAPAPAAPAAPAPAPAAPTPISSYASEEIIEFGRPAKKARTSVSQQAPPPSAPPARMSLSLPNGDSGFVTMPSALPARPPPAPSSRSAPPPPEPVIPAPHEAESSDEEEDWEQVPTATPTIPQASSSNFDHLTLEEELEEEIFGDGFADDDDDDGGEAVDIDPLELEEQMEEEDEDFLDAVLSPAPPERTGRPMSLNEMAGGAPTVLPDSDDDYTSSDDSEDD